MPNVHVNKAKPPWLPEPCASCSKYEETEAELDPTRKAILGNPKLNQHFNRCKYDPRFADPDLARRCPFARWVGKPVIVLTCDVCGDIIKHLAPDSEELELRLATKKEDGVTQFDICDACKRQGKEPDGQLRQRLMKRLEERDGDA